MVIGRLSAWVHRTAGAKFMHGKTIVITGATSGIGWAGAHELAKMGGRIVFTARDKARADALLESLNAAAPNLGHAAFHADLSLIADMKRVSAEIAAAAPQIDVLLNNAGGLFGERKQTGEGVDLCFATNHLSYFVLTNFLLPQIKAAPAARIVSTSSSAYSSAPKLVRSDVQTAGGQNGPFLYGLTKLYNILFTRELARRLEGSSVSVSCFHPGLVSSRFASQTGGWISALFGVLKPLFGVSPERGADTMVYLASAPEAAGANGGYYHKRKLTPTSAQANDADAARWLWDESAKLCGMD